MIKHHLSPSAPPSRVVVLGASGFVGKSLVQHLAGAGIPTLPLSSAQIDLCHPEAAETLGAAVREGDALVLVSAITPDKGRDTGTLLRNLAMGDSVSRFLERSACCQVVYVSSDAVYPDGANPVRETTCCSPSSLHGLMHLTREGMLAYAVRNSDVPLLVLRPSLLYGAKDTHNGYGPNRFLRTARSDHKITLFGNGEEKRDHVYVEDLSSLIGLGLTHRSEGVLNVATGQSTSFLEVARLVANLHAEQGESVEIEYRARTVPVTHRHFDIAATLKTFPQFRYTPLEKGLSETFGNVAPGLKASMIRSRQGSGSPAGAASGPARSPKERNEGA